MNDQENKPQGSSKDDHADLLIATSWATYGVAAFTASLPIAAVALGILFVAGIVDKAANK